MNPGRIQRLGGVKFGGCGSVCWPFVSFLLSILAAGLSGPEAQLQSVLEVCPGLDPTSEQRRDALSFIRADARHEADLRSDNHWLQESDSCIESCVESRCLVVGHRHQRSHFPVTWVGCHPRQRFWLNPTPGKTISSLFVITLLRADVLR